MKTYGIDYTTQYNILKRNEKSLDGKVRKRCKFLMNKIHGKPLWLKYRDMNLDSCSIEYVLMIMCEIEDDYVNQSVQGSLFPDENKD